MSRWTVAPGSNLGIAVAIAVSMGIDAGAATSTTAVTSARAAIQLPLELQKLRSADAVTVSATRYGPDRPAGFGSARPCNYRNAEYNIERRLEKRWVSAICNVLAACEGGDNGTACAAACPGDTSYTGSLQLTFDRGQKTATLGLRLDRGLGWLALEPGKPQRCISLAGRSTEVLQILRDALAEPAFLHRQRICTPEWADSSSATRRAARMAAGEAVREAARQGEGGEGGWVSLDAFPEAIAKVTPEYPETAKLAGISGQVLIQALISKSGDVLETRILESVPALDRAAVLATEQWKFKPAMSKGEPVTVWVAIPVHFTLR